MAAATVCDKAISLTSSANIPLSRTTTCAQSPSLPLSQYNYINSRRNDRWSAKLNVSAANDGTGPSIPRSLTMPVSTGCHSLLATTTTLPSVLEIDDNGRLASYQPTPPSSSSSSSSSLGRPSLKPHPQTSIVPVSNGTYRPPFINDSANSSPSTTTSTLNSAVTESSPVSSPQSPNSLLHSPFRIQKATAERPATGLTIDTRPLMDSLRANDVSPSRPSTSMSDSAALRKGRNMKNLSINTNGISTKETIDGRANVADPPRPATQQAAAPAFKPGNLPAVSESAPASPTFIIPTMPPRRKPSKLGLTISTPETDQKAMVPPTPGFSSAFASRNANAPAPITLRTVPQTPAFPPALNFQKAGPGSDSFKSPPMGSSEGPAFAPITGKELRTPGFAPRGGMTLPSFSSVNSSPARKSSPGTNQFAPFALSRQKSEESMGSGSEIVHQTIAYRNEIPAIDRPLSQEVKSPSYPEGPACIYPPSVFLYHQPTADEARDFDVIINVAREVTNPFEVEAEEEKERLNAKDTVPVQPARPSYRSIGVQTELLTEDFPPRKQSSGSAPNGAASDISFHDALERLNVQEDDEVPKTPKATKYQPEYIHLPWEHNSKVYEEWYEICKLIDERTKQGKKVLIHCQLGVSRSASLIVAYGIYLNPKLRPDEAREQAKTRSRWIDLNMHFMYELGDFKKLLQQKGVAGTEQPTTNGTGSVKSQFAGSLQRSKTDVGMLSPVLSMPPTPLSGVSDLSGPGPCSSDDSKDEHFESVPESEVVTPSSSFAPVNAITSLAEPPKRQPSGQTPTMPALTTRFSSGPFGSESTRLPPPAEQPQRQPSPALRTPGFGDMPGGWARTPADSRPASMVLPNGLVGQEALNVKAEDRTPTQKSPLPSPDPSIRSNDDKVKRSASFRALPRMPSFGSGLSSLGSFFLKRSSSSASKHSRRAGSPAPDAKPSAQRRTSTQALTPLFPSQADPSPSEKLKKAPSLPSLRAMFQNSPTPHKPTLNLTLEPIPQSAVGQGPSESELAAMMSPRAQEFVPAPFVRPTTSHHVMSGLTMDEQKQADGKAAGRKRQSLSLEEMNALNATNAAVNQVALADLRRAESGASSKKEKNSLAVVTQHSNNWGDDSTRELMSPGAQARDPRSPPTHGTLAKEERVMPSIDDVL